MEPNDFKKIFFKYLLIILKGLKINSMPCSQFLMSSVSNLKSTNEKYGKSTY